LNGVNSIVGRSVALHIQEDNYGSDKNGDSGYRVACGVIGWASEPGDALWFSSS